MDPTTGQNTEADSIQEHQNKIKQGLKSLFSDCLSATKEDNVSILVDESVRPYFQHLVEVVNELSLNVTPIFLPISYQTRLVEAAVERVQLPDGLKQALNHSSVVANLLNGELRTGALRKSILNARRPSNCRFAHVPGLANEVLVLLNEWDVESMLSRCELVAWALGDARSMTISTGKSSKLELKLGDWSNQPLMSPGVIFEGGWGNVPPGETFCLPVPGTGCGTIAISGSLPNRSLDPEKPVYLCFENGNLISWESDDDEALMFFEQEKKNAYDKGDCRWTRLCEVGFGLNSTIRTLTGNSLFDEKAIGTVHIAIGDNTIFGGEIAASIHADLVCSGPSVCLDEFPMMESGRIKFDEIRKRRDSRKYDHIALKDGDVIDVCEGRAKTTTDKLMLRLDSGGRVGFIQIASDEASKKLSVLFQELKNRGQSAVRNLRKTAGFANSAELDLLLRTLLHHQIARRVRR